MSECDSLLRDYRFPDTGYDGTLTFAGVLRPCFVKWSADAKAAGLPKRWLPSTAKEYAMHYRERILPLLDPNKPLHEYTEDDFNQVLEQLREKYYLSDSTLEHYRNLLWIVYKAGFEAGLYPDNIFWGEVYDPSEHTDRENEVHRAQALTRVRKSFQYHENLKIIDWFRALDPETAPGESVGLLIMYFHGARNNEACGMNYGHLYYLPKYPDLPLIDLIQSTQINRNQVKAGGKTGNAPRTLLAMQPFVEFLLKRRAAIERKIASGEFVLPKECEGKVDNLPVACRGTSYGIRCSSRDLSIAGRKLFEQIGIRNGELAELNRMLKSQPFQNPDIDEKEVTTYLFRRNFATTLYALGLPLSDIQYYLGHDVEDPDTARNHYTNKDKLLEIKAKLDWHYVYAVLGQELPVIRIDKHYSFQEARGVPANSIQIVFGEKRQMYLIDVQCVEPEDEIQVNISSDQPIDAVFDVNMGFDRYTKTADVRVPVWENYRKKKK